MKHKSDRKRLSAIGAITCEADASGRELLLRFEDRPVNEDIVISFVEGLRTHVGRRVVLLWDGLSSHRSTKTQEYIASQSDWLTVERFPAYAPELNPIEYLWSSAKSKGVGNLCPDNLDLLLMELETIHQKMAESPDLLQGFLKASGLFDDQEPPP